MARYLLIDEEKSALNQLTEAIKSVDEQSIIVTFPSRLSFEQELKKMTEGEQAEYLKFDLVVAEFTSVKDMVKTPLEWVTKVNDFKSKLKPNAQILLTSYEDGSLNLKLLKKVDIYNLLYKPFDPLILKESLNLALNFKKRVQPKEIKAQNAAAFVALLKDIELETMSELGFVTLSDSEIPQFSISKYFSPLFSHGKKQSVWAQCLMSIPHPHKPGNFINKFQFFGINQGFLMKIRKYVQTNKIHEASNALWNLADPHEDKQFKAAIVSTDQANAENLKDFLEKQFTNLSVEIVRIDPKKKEEATLLEHDIVINMTDIKGENITPYFKPTAVHYWYCSHTPTEEEMLASASVYKDIFLHPLDKSYFYKKLKTHLYKLKPSDPIYMLNITCHETLKAAHNVKISEICEVFININHTRELPYRSFREFVFINDDENQMIELPAFVHFSEKSKTPSADPKQKGPQFFHQFIFWGMTDHLFKQIRLWLLHNYIVQKKDD